MSDISHKIAEIVPAMYENIATEFRFPPHTNMAGTNQCHVLTRGLHMSLAAREIESRREFHQLTENGGRLWHFVIAHTPVDADPTEDDLITDLNPWQYMERPGASYTYLHAPRGEVMERLAREGAPDYFVALRGLDTVVHAHTDMGSPSA